VFATFSLAIAKAAEACPEAEKLMEIAAFLAPERIPLDIIAEDVMSEKQQDKAVATLYKMSLVTHAALDYGLRGISTHKLVQHAARARITQTSQITALTLTLLTRLHSRLKAYLVDSLDSARYRSVPSTRMRRPHGLSFRS
jgi:hypothetical protein